MNIILCGAHGAMGKYVQTLVNNEPELHISAGIDKTIIKDSTFPQFTDFSDDVKGDVIIDFSHHTVVPKLLDYCEKTSCPAVICTTALDKQTENKIYELSKKIPIFKSANMSLGIHILIKLVKEAYKNLGDDFDTEIIEKHHNKKVDAPSGTAKMIANEMNNMTDMNNNLVYGRFGNNLKRDKNEIGIHSIRGGNIVGEHDIIFAGMDEIIEIKHQASSKIVFAKGAITAAKFLINKPAGMYDMKNII